MLRGWRKVTDIYETSLYPWMETEAVSGHDGDLVLTITGVWEGEISTPRGEEPKVAVRFRETSKLLILNKTNASTLWSLFSRKTEKWIGQQIALYAKRVKVGGTMMDAIRIRPHRPEAPSSTEPEEAAQAQDVGPSEFWTEFNTAAREGKLPNAEQLRTAEEIEQAKASGDWAEALRWLRGQMRFS